MSRLKEFIREMTLSPELYIGLIPEHKGRRRSMTQAAIHHATSWTVMQFLVRHFLDHIPSLRIDGRYAPYSKNWGYDREIRVKKIGSWVAYRQKYRKWKKSLNKK